MSQRIRAGLIAALVVPVTSIFFLVNGCTSSADDDPGPGPGERVVPKAECQPKCEAKATSCGASVATAKQVCPTVCESATEGQLRCLEGKPCSELSELSDLEAVCPKTPDPGPNPSTKKQFGDACTCPDISSPTAEGYCSGTDAQCAAGLKCVFAGGNGRGECMAESCCSKSMTECSEDPSLLTSCDRGRCRGIGYVGYFCGK